MLETIKSFIVSLPEESFQDYYVKYILDTQDSNIEEEFAFLMKNNSLDVSMMSAMMDSEIERFGESYDLCRFTE